MKKKIVSVILVAAMAVGCLAGCGSKEAKNEDASEELDRLPVMQQFTEQPFRTVHRLLSMRLMKPVELTVIRLNIISRMIRETLKRQQTHTTP